MTENLKQLLTAQFEAALSMLEDCVETCPPADNGNTAALAARLVRHTIGAVAKAQPRNGAD